jgi:hypothetical protein
MVLTRCRRVQEACNTRLAAICPDARMRIGATLAYPPRDEYGLRLPALTNLGMPPRACGHIADSASGLRAY